MMKNSKLRYLIWALVLFIVFSAPQLLLASDGITLEELSEKIEVLFRNQSDSNDRISAIETRLAPTVTKTRQPTPTVTATRTPQPTSAATVFLTPTPEPLLRVNAEQAFRNYRKYEGMMLEVHGEVIKKQDDKVELHVPGWFSYFICWLSSDQENLPLVLRNRQQVVLLGENISKESNTVSMNNCIFVSPSPTELRNLNATRVASTATARSVKATATAKAQETRASERATRESAKETKEAATAIAKSTQEVVNATATATHRHQGFHCLSAWDGQSRQMNDLIKTYLNDPSSMEVHSTKIAPETDGTHLVIVDFGAKNALGGMVRNIAKGLVDHETCEALVVLEIEPK